MRRAADLQIRSEITGKKVVGGWVFVWGVMREEVAGK